MITYDYIYSASLACASAPFKHTYIAAKELSCRRIRLTARPFDESVFVFQYPRMRLYLIQAETLFRIVLQQLPMLVQQIYAHSERLLTLVMRSFASELTYSGTLRSTFAIRL